MISVVYRGNKKHRVHEVLHEFSGLIHSSMHTHFNETCVEQLVLKGDPDKVRTMLERLMSVKDVRVCNCIV